MRDQLGSYTIQARDDGGLAWTCVLDVGGNIDIPGMIQSRNSKKLLMDWMQDVREKRI